MICIGFVGVLDSKVINHQGKSKWPGVMHPQPGCDWAGMIATGCQKHLELVISQFAGLWQTTHAPSDFNIDLAIVHQQLELVVLHDGWRDYPSWDVHVGIVLRLHGCAQIEVLQVAHHALGIGGGEDTVEQ